MALITYDKQNFLASLEPGIVTLVVQSFEDKLSEKLNGIVQEVYDELKKELPSEIKSTIQKVFDISGDNLNINVRVDYKEFSNGQVR